MGPEAVIPGMNPQNGQDLIVQRRKEDLEKLRSNVASLKEISQVDDQSVQRYIDFLLDSRNRAHFATPPSTPEAFRALAKSPGYHPLVGTNGLGEVVGGVVINDAIHPLHDHFIELFVVDPELQGRQVGTKMMIRIIDWACTTQTGENPPRWRRKLDAAIVKDVSGWERMKQLVQGLGFRRVSTLPEQVSVIEKRGGVTVFTYKPTQRYELMLERWRSIRELPIPPVESPDHFIGK